MTWTLPRKGKKKLVRVAIGYVSNTFSSVVVSLSYAHVVFSYVCVAHSYVFTTFGYVVTLSRYACTTFCYIVTRLFMCVSNLASYVKLYRYYT